MPVEQEIRLLLNRNALLTLYGDGAGVGTEVSIWAIVEDRRVGFVGGL